MELGLAHVVLFVFNLVEILFVLDHLIDFPFPFKSFNFMWSHQHIFKVLIGLMLFFVFLLEVFFLFIDLMMKHSLELPLDIFLSPEFLFVANLASDLSDFDAFVNELLLEVVSLLVGTNILVLDVLLVVHDHLIILKR